MYINNLIFFGNLQYYTDLLLVGHRLCRNGVIIFIPMKTSIHCFHNDYPEFPMLHSIISHCVDTHSSLRYDLWTFLLLWKFGGLYVHFDYSVGSFDTSTISKDHDGFFFIDPETNGLSTKVFAVSKNHPLMYYTIQRMIGNILSSNNTINNQFTGASALTQAFHDFRRIAFLRSNRTTTRKLMSLQRDIM